MILFGDGIGGGVLCWEGGVLQWEGGFVIHTCPKPKTGGASDLTSEGGDFSMGGGLLTTPEGYCSLYVFHSS